MLIVLKELMKFINLQLNFFSAQHPGQSSLQLKGVPEITSLYFQHSTGVVINSCNDNLMGYVLYSNKG